MSSATLLPYTVFLWVALLLAPDTVSGETKVPAVSDNDQIPFLKDVILPDVVGFWSNATKSFIQGGDDRDTIPDNMKRCNEDISNVTDAFLNRELWALRMVDASSKLQSGLLEGNIVDLGQWDECFKINVGYFTGRHCLAAITPTLSNTTTIDVPSDLMNGALTLTSAICLPSTCDNVAAQNVINQLLEDHLNNNPVVMQNGIRFTAKVNPEDCHDKVTKPWLWKEIIVVVVCAVLVLLVIACTLADLYLTKVTEDPGVTKRYVFLKSFSAWRNCKRLVKTNMAEGTLSCINGARFLSIAWVAFGHRFKFTAQQPLTNLLILPDMVKEYWSMIVVNATLSVDVFFLLGGLLNAYVYMKQPGRTHGVKSTLVDYVHRYLRLTPAYALMIAITATWLYRLGEGPLWDRIVGSATNDCQNEWLPGLLYINNYYKSSSYCMMQSWYLAADMQMFFLSPILLYPLWRWPKAGFVVGGFLIILSIFMPFYVAFVEEIKAPIPLSRNVARVQREMETLYLPTHTKTVSYVIGIFLGYLIYLIKTNKIKWNLTTRHKIIGWVLAILFMGGSLFGGHPIFQIDHAYNKWESSLYIGFYRFFWALGIGWVFLACSTGNGGIVTSVLNCKPLIILGRLTYGIYLTHVAVILYKMGRMRQPVFLDPYDQFQQFLGELIISTICSLILTLLLESPFLTLEKIFIKRRAVAPDETLAGRANGERHRRSSNPIARAV